MKRNRLIITTAFLGLLFQNSWAQDVHFSHMEFSPLTLNPALAGANSPMQAVVNYRNQWSSVAVPYSTIAASFDMRFTEKSRNKSGYLVGGVNFFNDNAGDLKISSNNVNLHLGYHLMMDTKNSLGLAIYTGYGQRALKNVDAKWSSQYSGGSYDPNLASGEAFNNQSFGYFDAGAGLVYTHDSNEGYMNQNIGRKINAGFAIYHLNRPSFSFVNKADENLYMRFSAFVNAEIGIGNSRGVIMPGVYFQRQKTAMEIYFGSYYKYIFHEGSRATGFTRPFSLAIGLFGRIKDAMVAKVMFEYDQFALGFGYDFNISSLTTASRARGGMEFFLRFNMNNGGGFRTGRR
ncbi:MAG: PorP/SprF family type IX secretion system membrane protein [Bacteroidota bacterium]